MRFSPDGRFLAFDLSADRLGAVTYICWRWMAAVRPLRSSIRATMRWAIAVKDGKPWGPVNVMRSAVAQERGRFAFGFTQTGALVYAISRATNSGTRVAQMDFASAQLASPPRDAGLELATLGGGAVFSARAYTSTAGQSVPESCAWMAPPAW